MDPLREMFHHHAWATLTLIDYCAKLSPAQLQASEPGTFGDIPHTLTHLVGADARYLEGMTGEQPDAPPGRGEILPLTELRARMGRQAQRWQRLLDRADELDVTLPAEEGGWPSVPHAENLFFLQAIHHGNDHRTQIGTILGVLGLEPPEVDGWHYWEAMHQKKTGA